MCDVAAVARIGVNLERYQTLSTLLNPLLPCAGDGPTKNACVGDGERTETHCGARVRGVPEPGRDLHDLCQPALEASREVS